MVALPWNSCTYLLEEATGDTEVHMLLISLTTYFSYLLMVRVKEACESNAPVIEVDSS